MSATGLGASVKRKEDIRFITGKGRYVDDVNRPGQAYAYFLRSPHAHATIDKIDVSHALNAKGVVAVYTGDDIAADKVGGLICGWMIHSKDGSPMKAGAHPALAQGRVRYVGDHVAVVIADTYAQARDAAEMIDVHYTELPVVVDPAKAAQAGQPAIHDAAPNNTVYNWHLGDKAATDAAFASAAHVTKLDLVNNRLIPNAMEPRAAVGDYDSGTDTITLYTTSQNPHVARLVLSAFIGLAPEHKLRVIAPDVGGGFGSKIFIYAEETVCAWAAKKIDRPVKWTAERSESFLSDAHGRDHVTHAEMALDAAGKITGVRVHTIANLGAYLSTFASSVPTYLYGRCCRASTTFRRSTPRWTRSTPRPRLSTPTAAPAVRKPLSSSSVWSNCRPGRLGATQPSSVDRISSPNSRTRRRSSWPTMPATTRARSTRRWRSPTTRGSAPARRLPPPRASCAASAFPPISRPAAWLLRRRSARSAPASVSGNRPRCASIRSAPSRC